MTFFYQNYMTNVWFKSYRSDRNQKFFMNGHLSDNCSLSCSFLYINDLPVFPIGESLFTLFASLTYTYHYLMTLIK